MADNQENTANNQKNGEDREVHIEPSEKDTSKKTGDPGRTPGKAEGDDDESATE